MQNKTKPEQRGDLVHGHSRLLWLIDEVDAHLEALWEPENADVAPILEELMGYWSALRAELGGHMHHEEDEIFGEVSRLAPQFASDITRLRGQHANLDTELQVLDGALRDLASSAGHSLAPAALRRAVTRFREHFLTHSREEREVLRDVQAVLPDLRHHD